MSYFWRPFQRTRNAFGDKFRRQKYFTEKIRLQNKSDNRAITKTFDISVSLLHFRSLGTRTSRSSGSEFQCLEPVQPRNRGNPRPQVD